VACGLGDVVVLLLGNRSACAKALLNGKKEEAREIVETNTSIERAGKDY
jgi:hypothetical protein